MGLIRDTECTSRQSLEPGLYGHRDLDHVSDRLRRTSIERGKYIAEFLSPSMKHRMPIALDCLVPKL